MRMKNISLKSTVLFFGLRLCRHLFVRLSLSLWVHLFMSLFIYLLFIWSFVSAETKESVFKKIEKGERGMP